jgi:predicted NUDIX family NTP pyrophosphohydrolase
MAGRAPRRVARREFEEETGTAIDVATPTIELGSIVQKGGKVVHAWAVEGDLIQPLRTRMRSRSSGHRGRAPQAVSEIDRVEWFGPIEARRRSSRRRHRDRPTRGALGG